MMLILPSSFNKLVTVTVPDMDYIIKVAEMGHVQCHGSLVAETMRGS